MDKESGFFRGRIKFGEEGNGKPQNPIAVPERKRGRVDLESGEVVPDETRKTRLAERLRAGEKLSPAEEEDLRQLEIKFGETQYERALRAWREKK